jgi:hypothetical protein
VERCALSTSASNFFPLSEHGKVESFGSKIIQYLDFQCQIGYVINSLTAIVVREHQLFYELLWARLYLPNFYPFTELDSWKNCY